MEEWAFSALRAFLSIAIREHIWQYRENTGETRKYQKSVFLSTLLQKWKQASDIHLKIGLPLVILSTETNEYEIVLRKGDTCTSVRFSASTQSFCREIKIHSTTFTLELKKKKWVVNVYQNLSYVLKGMKILDIAMFKVISPIVLSFQACYLTVPVGKKTIPRRVTRMQFYNLSIPRISEVLHILLLRHPTIT